MRVGFGEGSREFGRGGLGEERLRCSAVVMVRWKRLIFEAAQLGSGLALSGKVPPD